MIAHNFSAGPAALPRPALESAHAEFLDFDGSGLSLMEMSHRGPIYERVHQRCIESLRALLNIPKNYRVLFMAGGARTQFALVPMNLCGPSGGGSYLTTGTWAQQAFDEAKKVSKPKEAFSSAQSQFDRVPQDDIETDKNSLYLHYTSNNTIYGTQFHHLPNTSGSELLVCDMSSDILSGPIDVSRFALIYAGAQKNMGPSGVTVVIVRDDILKRSRESLPMMFNYQSIAAKNSMLNTPPTYPIYMVGKVAEHWLELGGLSVIQKQNVRKAKLLYDAIDDSDGFYLGHAEKNSRSLMNVSFRLNTPALETAFLEGSIKRSMIGLKGHRSVGGIRASIYNAVPETSAEALAHYMREFLKENS